MNIKDVIHGWIVVHVVNDITVTNKNIISRKAADENKNHFANDPRQI